MIVSPVEHTPKHIYIYEVETAVEMTKTSGADRMFVPLSMPNYQVGTPCRVEVARPLLSCAKER